MALVRNFTILEFMLFCELFLQLQAFLDQRLKEMEDDTDVLSSNQVRIVRTCLHKFQQ